MNHETRLNEWLADRDARATINPKLADAAGDVRARLEVYGVDDALAAAKKTDYAEAALAMAEAARALRRAIAWPKAPPMMRSMLKRVHGDENQLWARLGEIRS